MPEPRRPTRAQPAPGRAHPRAADLPDEDDPRAAQSARRQLAAMLGALISEYTPTFATPVTALGGWRRRHSGRHL